MSIYQPTYFRLSQADWVPKRREVSAVTNAEQALVTTTENHGYEVGQFVRLHVDKRYLMEINGEIGKILTIPTDDTFTVDVDTSQLATYTTPTYSDGNGYTQSHVVPVTGTEINTA